VVTEAKLQIEVASGVYRDVGVVAGGHLTAGGWYRPFSLVTTGVITVKPCRWAITTAPSIRPSASE